MYRKIVCTSAPSFPPSHPLFTVGLHTPGLHKLGPWKTSKWREKRDAWGSEGWGDGGVQSSGSFSIPMEQKVNDGPIVLWESWPEEKCYWESPLVPVSSDKRGLAIGCTEFLPYLYHLHVCTVSKTKNARSHPRFCMQTYIFVVENLQIMSSLICKK